MYDVLILEDNLQELKEIESVVKDIDEELSVCLTRYSQEALEVAEENDIKLFLIDIDIPDFSGLRFAEYLRQMDSHKLTTIVFISSLNSDELSIFKSIHCYDYVLKPFDKNYLKELLETIINSKVKNKVKKYLQIQYRSFNSRIAVEDIVYIERVLRKLYIFTKKENYIVSNRTLSSLLEELGNSFIQPYRSIIINSNFIDCIDLAGNKIYLKYIEESIPIGRIYKKSVKDLIICK